MLAYSRCPIRCALQEEQQSHSNLPLMKLVMQRWFHSALLRALCVWQTEMSCDQLSGAEVSLASRTPLTGWCVQVAAWGALRWRNLVAHSGPTDRARIGGTLILWRQHHVACSVATWRAQAVRHLMRVSLQYEQLAGLQYQVSRAIADPFQVRVPTAQSPAFVY